MCDAEVGEQAVVCWRCQAQLEPDLNEENTIQCPHCERVVAGEHAFCPYCGSSLRAGQSERSAAETSVVAHVDIDPERLRRIRERRDLWGAQAQAQAATGPAGPPPLEEGAISPPLGGTASPPVVPTAIAEAARGRLGRAYAVERRTMVRPTVPLAAAGLLAGAAWFGLSIAFLVGRPAMMGLPLLAQQAVVSDLAVVLAGVAWMLVGAGIGALVAGASPKSHATAAKAGGSVGILMGLAAGGICYLTCKAAGSEQAATAVSIMPVVILSAVWSLVKGALLGVLTFTLFRAIFKEEAASYT